MSHKNSKTTLCPAGHVPGLGKVLRELEMDPGEFAFRSGLPFALIFKIVEDKKTWVEAKDRERILETVTHMRREKRDAKMAAEEQEIREVMR